MTEGRTYRRRGKTIRDKREGRGGREGEITARSGSEFVVVVFLDGI